MELVTSLAIVSLLISLPLYFYIFVFQNKGRRLQGLLAVVAVHICLVAIAIPDLFVYSQLKHLIPLRNLLGVAAVYLNAMLAFVMFLFWFWFRKTGNEECVDAEEGDICTPSDMGKG